MSLIALLKAVAPFTDLITRALERRGTLKKVILPLILEACAENESALEYRHGVTSYGAFTYSLALNLRRYKRLSFDRLVRATTSQLARLGYDQKPQLLGPTRIRRGRVRWTAA